MERLTMTSNKGGLAFAFDLDITCNPSEARKIQKLGEKLKAYEDTGLSPADIPALTARAEAAEAERDAAVEDLKQHILWNGTACTYCRYCEEAESALSPCDTCEDIPDTKCQLIGNGAASRPGKERRNEP